MQTLTKELKATDFSQDFTAALFADAGAPTSGAYASVVLNPAGVKNALKVVAQTKGAGGNDVTVTYAAAATSADPTTVTVADKAITVHCRKNIGGDIIATAREVAAAIAAYPAARALVRTEYASDTGTGEHGGDAVAALGPTNLAGGVDSAAYKAWAKVGTIKPGNVPVGWSIDCREAFPAVDDTDLNTLELYAHQAAGTGAARWYSDLFEQAQPLAGGALSAVRAMAAKAAGWLGSGQVVDPAYFVAALTTMKATAYTLAHTAMPAGSKARHITLLVTKQGAALDTLGDVSITGTAEDGSALIEVLTLVEGANVSVGKFATVSEIITSGWITDGTADQIGAGFAADGVDPILPADLYAILSCPSDDSLATIIDPGSPGDVVVSVAAV